MSTLLNAGNPLTMDDERRLAHRDEIKRKLAQIDAKKSRIAEMRSIVERIEADSEAAADRHREEAGTLQNELETLEAEHIENVLADKQTPEKNVKRRSEILQEISKLNQILETTVEANRNAMRSTNRDIDELTSEITDEGALKNRLARLCSPQLRRESLLNDLLVKASELVLTEARRLLDVVESNGQLHEENERLDKASIYPARIKDHKWVVDEAQRRLDESLERGREIQRQAMKE